MCDVREENVPSPIKRRKVRAGPQEPKTTEESKTRREGLVLIGRKRDGGARLGLSPGFLGAPDTCELGRGQSRRGRYWGNGFAGNGETGQVGGDSLRGRLTLAVRGGRVRVVVLLGIVVFGVWLLGVELVVVAVGLARKVLVDFLEVVNFKAHEPLDNLTVREAGANDVRGGAGGGVRLRKLSERDQLGKIG